jgi:hypothetical protein
MMVYLSAPARCVLVVAAGGCVARRSAARIFLCVGEEEQLMRVCMLCVTWQRLIVHKNKGGVARSTLVVLLLESKGASGLVPDDYGGGGDDYSDHTHHEMIEGVVS